MPVVIAVYVYINASIQFGLVWFYGISTIVGYSMPNPVYTYIVAYMFWFGLVWFYGISTIVGYSMPNPVNKYILNIYGLVWFGLMAINRSRLYNARSSLYVYIKHI